MNTFRNHPRLEINPDVAYSEKLVQRGLINSILNLSKTHLAQCAEWHMFLPRSRSAHVESSEDITACDERRIVFVAFSRLIVCGQD